MFKEPHVEPTFVQFNCNVQPNPNPPEPSRMWYPGSSRDYQGWINFPFRVLHGLCETSGMREAVHFDIDTTKKYVPCYQKVKVRVTLDNRAPPTARVQPALYVVGIEHSGREFDNSRIFQHNSIIREWRTILPLEPYNEVSGQYVDKDYGPEYETTSQPTRVFRAQKLVIEPEGVLPEHHVTCFRFANLGMWFGGVPAGIFVKEIGYEPPELDCVTMHPANRMHLNIASKGRGGNIVAKLHGLIAVPQP
jgi:hypothetical protein